MTQPSEQKESFFTVQARHAQQCTKEAWIVSGIWLAGLVYCSTAISILGYVPTDQRPAEPELVLGMPSWVFWGLFLPWFVLIGATWWFAGRCLKDDEPYMKMPDGDDTRSS